MGLLDDTDDKIITFLLDNKGHAPTEIAKKLGVELSNISSNLKKLKEMNFLYELKRYVPVENYKGRGPKTKTIYPLYISKNRKAFRVILNHIIDSSKDFEQAYLQMSAFEQCPYFCAVWRELGEDVIKSYTDPIWVEIGNGLENEGISIEHIPLKYPDEE